MSRNSEVSLSKPRWIDMRIREVIKRCVPEPILVWRHRRFQQRAVRAWGLRDAAKRYMDEHGSMVSAGPFAGLRLPDEAPDWEQCAVIPTLRGTYEREIMPLLAELSSMNPQALFVDIGCAEGTYLTGMARRGHRAVGFELDPVRRRRARSLAEFNAVAVDVRGRFEAGEVSLDGALVLCDIEGGEVALFRNSAARFRLARVIVELHDDARAPVVAALGDSHDVRIIPFEGREDPLEAEHRPAEQCWGVFTPKSD